METLGIAFGLGAAFCQAATYLFSRRFLQENVRSARLLFALTHFQLGLFCAALLPLLWPAALPPWRTFIWPLLGNAAFYLVGQWLLLVLLKDADSSLLAPLLGLKIPMLGIFSALFLLQPLSPTRWIAVIICTVAGLLLAPPHAWPQLRVLLMVVPICLGFAGSDLCIPSLVRRLSGASAHPALLAVCLSYVVCGLVGLVVLLRQRRQLRPASHLYALPCSVAWLMAMFSLFACFAAVGVVFGNMLQSTRGPMAIALGYLVGRVGFSHLDAVASRRSLLLRRAAGAAIMTGAIVLYLRAG